MPPYHRMFSVGERVTIHDTDRLLDLSRDCNWKLTAEQLSCGGSEAMVQSVGYFHGGRVLHELKEAPGLWPEEFLFDSSLHSPVWWGYPRTGDYYQVISKNRDSQPYVVIADTSGVECVAIRDPRQAFTAAAISEVASKRNLMVFEERYGFVGTFDWKKHTGYIEYWKDLDIHHVDLVDLEESNNSVIVILSRRDNGKNIRVQFENAHVCRRENLQYRAIFGIARCKYDQHRQLYRFIFEDLRWAARLNIVAAEGNCEYLPSSWASFNTSNAPFPSLGVFNE